MATKINPYKDAHKGIRQLLVELLVLCGRTDSADQTQMDILHKRFVKVQDLLDIHSQVEDELLAPLIEASGLGNELKAIEGAHRSLHGQANALNEQFEALIAGDADVATFQAFYIALSRYVGEQLQHMVDEEETIWPVLSESCEDGQMTGFQAKARDMSPPAVMQTLLGAMIPAINDAERRVLLGGMKNNLPKEAFARICELSRKVLPDREWGELARFLELAQTA